MSRQIVKVEQIEIRYLVDGAQTGGLGLFEMKVPAGAHVPPPHSHSNNEECVYAIEGTLRYTVGDVTRDLRPGDRVEVLIERRESPEGERRLGRILAARVDVAGSPSFAFAYRNGFYDERGRSLRRAFLRAPVAYRHVSSRFGGRYHPILKQWRSHQGTDYAAGYGTPVRATADGVVTMAGRNGGYGNLIELRHANGIRTRYGHLSKFAKGVRVGQRVSQEQTIGYVGSTGLSTGPHLHYEFLVNGRPTNPQRKDFGAGVPVAKEQKAAFDSTRVVLLAELEPTGIPAASPALGAAAARDD